MSWIKTIELEESEGKLKKIYQRAKGPNGKVDNIMLAHSLRPHSMEGHMSLYKNVLHHANNELPKWYLETIGVYVSLLNQCHYCIEHHYAGLKRLLENDGHAEKINKALVEGDLESEFSGAELSGLQYAKALTVAPASVTEEIIQDCREQGFDDGKILEINQVTAYFNYANRTVLGLGVTLKNETLGLSPT